MAISRPFLLALLGALLLGVTVIAVQSTRSGTDSDTTPAAVQTEPAPAQPTAAKASPTETLNSAFAFNGLESATVNARLVISDGSEAFRLRLSGAFERGAANDVPKFAVDVHMAGQGQRARGGLVSLGERAFFTRGDVGWRVPAAAWGPIVEGVSRGGGLPFQIDPNAWVREVKSEGTESVGGVETDHVTAVVDPKAMLGDLNEVTNSRSTVRGLERASLDAWVGADDQILRRLSVQLVYAKSARITIDVRLSNVNKPQEIEAPSRVLQGAPGGLLGQFAGGVVRGATGGTSLAALTSPNPRRAARAVRDHRKVVILFRNPRGLDDRAMSSVMRAVDSRTKALVLTDHVDAVERYGKLVEDLGVSQTPSVVIIDRSGKARLIEGYVDSDTLAQAVSDAR